MRTNVQVFKAFLLAIGLVVVPGAIQAMERKVLAWKDLSTRIGELDRFLSSLRLQPSNHQNIGIIDALERSLFDLTLQQRGNVLGSPRHYEDEELHDMCDKKNADLWVEAVLAHYVREAISLGRPHRAVLNTHGSIEELLSVVPFAPSDQVPPLGLLNKAWDATRSAVRFEALASAAKDLGTARRIPSVRRVLAEREKSSDRAAYFAAVGRLEKEERGHGRVSYQAFCGAGLTERQARMTTTRILEFMHAMANGPERFKQLNIVLVQQGDALKDTVRRLKESQPVEVGTAFDALAEAVAGVLGLRESQSILILINRFAEGLFNEGVDEASTTVFVEALQQAKIGADVGEAEDIARHLTNLCVHGGD